MLWDCRDANIRAIAAGTELVILSKIKQCNYKYAYKQKMADECHTSSTDFPAKASVMTMPVKPIMAVLPFQFSALGVQMPFAKGSLRVYPLQRQI